MKLLFDSSWICVGKVLFLLNTFKIENFIWLLYEYIQIKKFSSDNLQEILVLNSNGSECVKESELIL